MKKTMAMILAGGRGKRMDILCDGRPKPLLPFAGNFRVIDFTLSNCIHSGINDISVLVDYQRRYMSEYTSGWRPANAGEINLHVLGPKADSYKGTADAVYQNIDCIKKHGAELILVLAGDHVYRMDYRQMLAFHERMDADVTVGVVPVPIEQAHRFGIVTADSEGRITDFVEKPKFPISNLVSMGIYVFNREALIEHLIRDAAIPTSPHDFGYALIPEMVKSNRVFAHEFGGYWQDIGTVQTYYEANMEPAHELSSLGLNGQWPIFTRENSLTAIHPTTDDNVEESLISPGCNIKGRVENSVLSPGVIVEEGAVVKNSLVMANTVIGCHSIVENSILDEGVTIGEFCHIGFRNSLLPGEWDITVVGKSVAVPPGTVIGGNCRIMHYDNTALSRDVVSQDAPRL